MGLFSRDNMKQVKKSARVCQCTMHHLSVDFRSVGKEYNFKALRLLWVSMPNDGQDYKIDLIL